MSLVLTHLFEHAASTPDLTAVRGDTVTLSYSDLADQVMRLAELLGRKKPSVVGLITDNGPHWVVCDLAAISAGIPLVPIPAFFTPLQIAHVIKDAGLDVVLAERDFPGCTSETVTVAGQRLYWVATSAEARTLPAGTAKITYTSGTTGTPKGVCLPQRHLDQVAQSLVTVLGTALAERHLAVLPLAVLLENVAGLYPTLIAGATYLAPSLRTLGYTASLTPNGSVLTDTMQRLRATSCILVPDILRELVATLTQNKHRLSDLKFAAVGGAPVSPTLIAQARGLGIPVYEGYGLSECGSVVSLNTPMHDQPGTTGRLLPHVALNIANDGELMIRTPGFLGYLGQQDTTTGNFATGDLGHMDNGFLTISGRKKNIIITAQGRNIAPEWVEMELANTAAIAQCAVFGDGEQHLTALVVPSTPDVSDKEIDAAVTAANTRLPIYAKIGAWTRVAPFTTAAGTLTANGRLRRAQIKSMHLNGSQPPSFFERLKEATAPEKAILFSVPQIIDGLAGQISRDTYVAYLTEAYHHVRHTVPLLRETLAHLPNDKAWLKPVLQDYIDEETGHEQWILNDIANAGGDAAAAASSQPRPATAAMVSYAYRVVRKQNPVAFFGMVFVLEGTSIELASRGAQALMTSLGLPPNCFSYLSSHGALDVGHMDFFRGVMNRITSTADQDAIILMAKAMFGLFANVFRSIPHPKGQDYAAE